MIKSEHINGNGWSDVIRKMPKLLCTLDYGATEEGGATYGDCIDAIVNSNVLGPAATCLIVAIPIGDYSDLYEGVIKIMKADYLGSTKERMVRTMISKVRRSYATI